MGTAKILRDRLSTSAPVSFYAAVGSHYRRISFQADFILFPDISLGFWVCATQFKSFKEKKALRKVNFRTLDTSTSSLKTSTSI